MEENKDINNAEHLDDDQLDDANGGLFPNIPEMILDPCGYYNPECNYVRNLCNNCPNFVLKESFAGDHQSEFVGFCGKAQKYFKKEYK